MNRINTKQLELCFICMCMTFTMMDKNGNRFCGKCKAVKPKLKKDGKYEDWLAEQQKEARLIEQNL